MIKEALLRKLVLAKLTNIKFLKQQKKVYLKKVIVYLY
jgi:hypothetical protein